MLPDGVVGASMDAVSLLIPRPHSPAADRERADEEDFQQLVESLETLLFGAAERRGGPHRRPDALRHRLLALSLTELAQRWPATRGRGAAE